MKGVGGPLLCIGDLLSDVGEEKEVEANIATEQQDCETLLSTSSTILDFNDSHQSLDLPKLFQEKFDQLNEALAGTDHSWTSLTLKLCNALETANKLVQSTNTNVRVLSEKVRELEQIIKKGDSAISSAKSIHVSLNEKEGSFLGR